MSNDVTIKLRGDKKDLDSALRSTETSVTNWAGYIKGALIGIGSALAVKKLYDFGATVNALYKEDLVAQVKLQSVIKATGGAAGYTLAQMKALASGMQELNGVGDEVILNAMAITSTFKNIRGDVFKDATQSALDMSAVLGGDLTSATMQVAKALNDPTVGITALSRAGVSFTQEQKDLIKTLQESGDMLGAQKVILDELKGEFGGSAAAITEATGGFTKFWNSIGDIGEQLGKVLQPALKALLPPLNVVKTVFENLADELEKSSGTVTKWSENWSQGLVESVKNGVRAIANGFDYMTFIYNNFGDLLELQLAQWALGFEQFGQTVKYFTTTQIPAYLSAMLEVHDRTFKILRHNYDEFLVGLQSMVSGEKIGFQYKSFSEELAKPYDAILNMTKPVASEAEKSLASYISNLKQKLTKTFQSTFNEGVFGDKLLTPRPAVDIDMKPNFEPFEVEAKKTQETVKKAADKISSDKQQIQESNNKATSAGAGASLLGLHADIQAGAFAASGMPMGGMPMGGMPMGGMPMGGVQFGRGQQLNVQFDNNGQPILTEREKRQQEYQRKKAEALARARERNNARNTPFGVTGQVQAVDDAQKAEDERTRLRKIPFSIQGPQGPKPTVNVAVPNPQPTWQDKLKNAVSINADAPATVGELSQIKDVLIQQHPELINALKYAGGLV